MLAVERIKLIQGILTMRECVAVSTLSAKFSVSEETIRRDLEKIGKLDPSIVRVHGGAYKAGVLDGEMPIRLRETMSVTQKKQIAKLCYPLLKPNSTIMMDCSTTTLYLAKLIKQNPLNITIITNSLRIAEEFEECDNVRLICIGGTLRKTTQSFVGYIASDALSLLHSDMCFVSCTGLDVKFGITDNNENEGRIRGLMLKKSTQKYLLVDQYKFGRSFANQFIDLEDITAIITEITPSDEWISLLEKNNVGFVCPQSPSLI